MLPVYQKGSVVRIKPFEIIDGNYSSAEVSEQKVKLDQYFCLGLQSIFPA